ncbi:diphthine--ammonia ligase [Clostridium rectalis]|uniref:Dph6-related ATP pyrophosphatase n=1 Tax=Clostridium rectalis TaxID=2040295 RepID=UPI0019D31E4B|nr:diphthine--ammonia ligase [Clostridium rectalis]
MNIQNKRFFCSWSGGKDSCLALYKAIKEGGRLVALFTMFTEEGVRSRSHGLDKKIIEQQAKVLKINLITASASWNDYEEVFLKELLNMKDKGIEVGVFGDIDLESSKQWVNMICDKACIKSMLPLWQEKREELVKEFIDLGFKAKIVSLKSSVMDKSYLGQILDKKLMNELKDIGVDPCGENGEFHTVVIDGPIFNNPLNLVIKDTVLKDGYWFLDMDIQ